MKDQLEDDLEVEEIIEDEAAEEADEVEDEPEAEETGEDEQDEIEDESDDDAGEEPDDDVLTIQLDGEDDDDGKDDPEAIRNMRQELKAKEKRIKELEQAAPKPEPVALGPKPTLQDHDYDTEAYDAALLAWNDQKKAEDAEAEKKAEAERARQEAYEGRLAGYDKRKSEMGVKDFGDAEDTVKATLTPVQQSIIVSASKDPALTVLALGRNAKHLERMAKLEPIQFAYELAELESKMKVSGKKKPQPEKRVSGASPAVPTGNKKLEQLRAEAAKTGDLSKVHAYKRQLRSQK